MRLEDLRVVHERKEGDPSPARVAWFEAQGAAPRGFYLNSCQRWLWAGPSETAATAPGEVLEGEAAYLLLLRVACGLESEIVGETDIFGQFKTAWANAAKESEVSAWVRRVFEDAKEVRSLYLQNVGGGSYGSLLRKLIQNHSGRGPLWLVGAGQLATAVAPFLSLEGAVNNELWLWNRGADRLWKLYGDLSGRVKGKPRLLENEEEGWREAATAIVCIPPDAAGDARRVALWNEGCERQSSRLLIHLGDRAERLGVWRQARGLHALDEVFELQSALGEVRSVQVARAARACEERAKLRGLGGSAGSISVPHGWEDLAAFG